LKIADDVNWNEISLTFELSGGLIKNAILSAISIAVSRTKDGTTPTLTHQDLVNGAKLQIRGRLRLHDFERRHVPLQGLDEVVVDQELKTNLYEIVNYEKARSVLFGQWGFSKKSEATGISVLFHGPPGTGKTLAASAIGFDLGKPLKIVNAAQLLSQWVGESSKNIDALFREAQAHDAVLVFDDAEGLFGSRSENSSSTADRYANVDISLLLYHIEKFTGVVILITNMVKNIDRAFFRRLRFVLEFPVPTLSLREALWKQLIPLETPKDDIDYKSLSAYEFTGGNIQSCIYRAATRCSLRVNNRKIMTQDLIEAAEEEMKKDQIDPSTLNFYT